MARSRSSSKPKRSWFSRLFRIALVALVIGLIIVGTSVAIAYSSLPGYEDLKKSPNGQMIRVRSADGTVIDLMQDERFVDLPFVVGENADFFAAVYGVGDSSAVADALGLVELQAPA